MSTPQMHDLAFDDENEEKLSERRISPEDALDLLERHHIIMRNKGRHRGLYKLIGRDRGGRILTIIVEPTTIKTTWRPVTGWLSSRAEERRFRG